MYSFPSIIFEDTILSSLGILKYFYWSKNIGQICVGLFLGSLFCSIDPCVYFLSIPYYYDYCSFVI